MSVEEALSALRIREKQTKDIYRNLYGFRLGEDYEPFHLILDTEKLDAEAVFQVLCVVIDSYVRYS